MPYAIIPENAIAALPELSGSAVRVMNALASFMPGRSAEGCYPSLEAIGERSGINRKKTIIGAIRELTAIEVLICERRSRRTSLFRWVIPEVAVSVPVMGAVSATRKDTRKETTDSARNSGKSPPKPKVVQADSGFIIPEAIRKSWAIAFPGIDIDREAAKAFAWCQNNPSKAPKKDYGRFLNSWLGRAVSTERPVPSRINSLLDDLPDKVNAVAATYGDNIARRYDSKARELKSTAAADAWLTSTFMREGVA